MNLATSKPCVEKPGRGISTSKDSISRAAKAQATREAKARQFADQTIVIDDDWRIVRADELNWEVQYKRQFEGYYGNLISAFQAVPAKMLGVTAKNSLAEVTERQAAILATIEKALQLKIAA